MGIMHKIHKDLKRDMIIENYSKKHRLIDSAIYNKLKASKKCMRCKKKFSGRIPEIHHKVPKSKGGSDDEKNLMAVCIKCHEILDAEQGVGDGKKL